jgi:hypothetical protein
MAGIAGTPMIIYGCETMGVSDSALGQSRSSIGHAAAAQAAGKNIEALFVAIDGDPGIVDPAFAAHLQPPRFWATAIWENWFAISLVEMAFTGAATTLMGAKGSLWSLVTGPASAIIATLRRIGWEMPNATEAFDDLGHLWSFLRDSPAAIMDACKRSVRRWRILRLGQILPGLIPEVTDTSRTVQPDSILIDCSGPASRLVGGKGFNKEVTFWEPEYGACLLSAMVAGQWTQTRRASVPFFGITDNRCQLCLQHPGTIAHRFVCTATCPKQGWPAEPASSKLATSEPPLH